MKIFVNFLSAVPSALVIRLGRADLVVSLVTIVRNHMNYLKQKFSIKTKIVDLF